MVVDLETTGGSPADRCHHRDRCGEGPRRRAARRVPDPGQPGRRTSRRSSPCSPASPTRWSPTRRRSPPCCRRSSSGPAARVLVAHNAPFDLGFLRAGCARLGLDWPGFDSVDTARLARRVLTRDEAPDCKLATLARLFRTTTTPCHRALADAQATTRRAARAVRAAGQPRRAHPRGPGDLHRARDRRPAPQALPRRRAAGRSGRLHLPRLQRPPALHRAQPAPAGPGPAVLRRLGAAHPDGRDGRDRRAGRRDRLRPSAGGRGPRAAPDRRAQAALQPPVAVPGAGSAG